MASDGNHGAVQVAHGCRLASAAADALQFNNAVRFSGFAKRRRRYVINGDSARSFAVENAIVSMTVKNSGHFESIDWLFQPAGAEKRINLGILPLQRGADRRVMQHYDPLFGLQFSHAVRLEQALTKLQTEKRIVVLHYSPIRFSVCSLVNACSRRTA